MSSNAFCALCGVQIEAHFGGEPQEPLLWTYEARAIRTRAYVHDAFVTGVGYLNFNLEVCADPDSSVHYTDEHVNWEAHESMYNGSYWSFPVHDICFRLLRRRVDPDQNIHANTVACHLFTLLYNTPTDGHGVLIPGHDYGGALEFQDPFNPDITASIYNSEYFYLFHDPRDEFDLHPEPALELTETLATLSISDDSNIANLDIFSELPSEIIVLILEHLPSKHVCNLRLASRYVASATHPWLLPQSFWLSRFLDGNDMAFVLADRMHYLREPLNWRCLYKTTKTMLKDPRTYPGFQNRYRIWNVLSHLAPALSLRILNEKWVTKSPYGGRYPKIGDGFSLHGTAAAHLTYEHESLNNSATFQLNAGVRLFEQQSLIWPKDCTIVRLGVTCVYINGETYVSGLRLLSIEDSTSEVESARAGFIYPLDEKKIEINQTHVLDSFQVHMSISGVVGIRIVTRGPNGSKTYSIGRLDLDPGEGISELANNGALHGVCFLIGLDACKLVSIRLIQSFRPGTVYDRKLFRDDEPAELWNPEIPHAEEPAWHSLTVSDPQPCNMCLNINLVEMPHVPSAWKAINVYMGEFPAVFLGLSFIHNDGSERLSGRKTYKLARDSKQKNCVVQSFPIAGDRGELINSIELNYSKKYDTIQAISFLTNAGRSVTFRLYGTDSTDGDGLVRSITATTGKMFTSFFVKLKSPSGYFRDFAARNGTAETGSPPKGVNQRYEKSHKFPINQEILSSAQDMLAYPGGFAFTSACLSNIRKICISTGLSGASRGTGHITGLRLEYHDSDVPLIVGQWVSELGCMKLSPGERLTGFATWHTFTNRFSTIKLGPIVALRLTTSTGVVKEYQQQRVDGKVYLQYQDNPYESLHSLIWGCNHVWDHVRVLYTPNPGKHDTTLMLTPLERQLSACMVPQRIFWRDLDPSGNLETVSVIEVSFKDLSNEPSGVRFIYPSGKTHMIGYRGEKPQSETINHGENLLAMELWILRGNRIGLIAFQTDQGRKVSFTYDSDMKDDSPLPIKSKRIDGLPVHKTHLYMLRGTNLDDDNDNSTAQEYNSVEKIPDAAGEFVGFWAITKRHDNALGYPMLGPIFEHRHRNDAGDRE